MIIFIFRMHKKWTDYNLGHNIFELYNVLPEIRLTTKKKMKRGI